MTAVRAGDEIRFSGPPRNASAIVALRSASAVVPISLKMGDRIAVHSAYVRPFGEGRSEIRLRLPAETPPGTYSGAATLAGEQRSVVVEVEPVTRVRIKPKQTAITAAAGASAEFVISVANVGNVAVEIPKTESFDLDDGAGQDRALGRALRADLSSGETRVDRFFEEIRVSHGGEARVSVRRGAGRLEPGESAELACVLDVPVMAQAGQTYSGGWQIGNAGHVVVVAVTKGASPANGRKKV